jgi:hypothetical protein
MNEREMSSGFPREKTKGLFLVLPFLAEPLFFLTIPNLKLRDWLVRQQLPEMADSLYGELNP